VTTKTNNPPHSTLLRCASQSGRAQALGARKAVVTIDKPQIVNPATQHTADFEIGLPVASARRELDGWITAQGHTPGPELWVCFVAGPESNPDPASYRPELNRPLSHLGA